jgi:tRNA(fMet)-specific endonuclease VapC
MTYALDTNIISFLLRPSHNQGVVQKFEEAIEQGNEYIIPPLCYYEIYWYLLRKKATTQLRIFERICQNASAEIIMREAEFLKAAELKAYLEEQGTPIGAGDADIFIAAYCIVNNYTLVTDNSKDFERIPNLQYVNWVR